MKDIDYFTESRMGEKNSQLFANELPAHLRTHYCVKSRDFMFVLQGYERSCSTGVEEIRYWHGTSKHGNWFPVLGTIAFTMARVTEHCNNYLDWQTLYYDEASGDSLSSSEASNQKKINKEAYDHNDEGEKYFKQKNYEKAYQEFDQAYNKCSKNYKYEQLFLKNRQKTSNAWAESIDSEGTQLYNEFNYKAAAEKFKLASEKAHDEDMKQSYLVKMHNAEAIGLSQEGDVLVTQKNYSQAVSKYGAAIDQCPASRSDTLNVITGRKNQALNAWAESLYQEGLELSRRCDFSAAASKFTLASEKTLDSAKKQNYQVEKQHAEALGIQQAGDDLAVRGNYSDSISKYQAAIDHCPTSRSQTRTSIKNKINETLEKWAQLSFFKGNELFIQGKFRAASDQFKLAHEKSINSLIKLNYLNEMLNADAMVLCCKADKLAARGNFEEANRLYSNGIDKAPTQHAETKDIIQSKKNEL
jgi:tetratricopeptide (TPR) repeat protein